MKTVRWGCAVMLAGMACIAAAAGRPLPRYAGREWPVSGGGYSAAYYSTLTRIDRANVARLGLAWSYDLGTDRVQEVTPIEVGGVLYTSGNLGRVYALDAVAGRVIWTFTPKVDMQVNRTACCDEANRGLAVADGKVFVASLDGVLYALDAKTGRIDWKVDTFVDHQRGYTITGAPTVARNVVIIGNAGSEYDVRGYVTAYDVATGREAWRFYVVPHDPTRGPEESAALTKALATWAPDSRWKFGGGGSPWDAIVYDPRFDTVYVGTGNGVPYLRQVRSPTGGRNLYLSSVVALDRRTGRLKWYYQETPGDSWDFDADEPMILTNLVVRGRRRPVIIHAPKNGFLFVIDRRTGRPVRIHRLVRTDWASGYDLRKGVAHLTPVSSDYAAGPKIVFPSTAGDRNWYPAAYDPQRHLYFADVLDMGNLIWRPPGAAPYRRQALDADAVMIFTPELEAALPTLPPAVQQAVKRLPQWREVRRRPYTNELRAIDPLTGRTRWAVPMAGWQDRSGVLATRSGLLFQGTVGGWLTVRDEATGKLLRSVATGSSMMAAPMTYEAHGVQYVAIAAGWGGGGWSDVPPYSAAYRYGNADRILVFKLGGGPVPMPQPLPPLAPAPAPPPQAAGVTAATLAQGKALFYANCAICHSNQPRSISPDLLRMPLALHARFRGIVLGGLLVPGGMPRWNDLLSPAQARAIHAYLIDAQAKARARELALQRAGKPLDAPEAAAATLGAPAT